MAKAKVTRKTTHCTYRRLHHSNHFSSFWMFPIVWIILTSFRGEGGAFVPYIIPKTFTLENYKVLLTNQTGNFPLSVGFEHLVRFHRKLSVINFHYNRNGLCAVPVAFPLKKTIFKSGARFKYVPGFMSMIAVYYILKALNLTESLFALILVYSAGSALGFTSPKGSSIPFRWL